MDGPFRWWVDESGVGVQDDVRPRGASSGRGRREGNVVRSVLAGVLVLCCVLAGCATVVADTAAGPPKREPDRIEPNTYSQRVSAADKVVLEVAERFRRLDPCALLPEQMVAEYGNVRAFGPRGAFDRCAAVLRRSGHEPTDLTVTVDLSPYPDGDGEQVTRFGDNRIQRMRSIEDAAAECTLRFVVDVPVTVSVDATPPVRFATVRAHEQSLSGVAPTTNTVCEVAEKALGAALDRIPDLPPRPTSGPGRIRLAAADPCEIVGLFAPEDLARWTVGADPYRCDYSVRLAGGGAKTWIVQFGLEPESALVAGPEIEEVVQGGRSFYVSRAGDLCRVAAPVENVVDTNRVDVEPEGRRAGRNVPTVIVSSVDDECARLVPLAANLADLALT